MVSVMTPRPAEADPAAADRVATAMIEEAIFRRITVHELAAEMRDIAVDAAVAGHSHSEAVNLMPPPDDELAALEARASVRRMSQKMNGDALRDDARTWPAPLDLNELAQTEPSPPQEIMKGLPCGYATLLAGHGGAGKSQIALTLAVCVATGTEFFGLPVSQRRAIYFSCEDRQSVLHWRLARICAFLNIEMSALSGHLEIVDLVARDTILFSRDPRTGNFIAPPYGEFQRLIQTTGSEFVVLDGLSDAFGGNENSRAEVKAFVSLLLAALPLEGALLLIAHVNKMTAGGAATSEGYSGSTGWHNSVRARWYLRPETKPGEDGTQPTGDLLLELQKANHGESDAAIRFRWDDAAHLFAGAAIERETEFDRKHRDREEQAAIRRALKGCAGAGLHVPAAMTGPRTALLVLSQRPEFPDSLRGGGRANSRRFWQQIEVLRHMLHVEEGSIGRKYRKHTATLELTTEGRAVCA